MNLHDILNENKTRSHFFMAGARGSFEVRILEFFGGGNSLFGGFF
jgi:hypothetical protein